MVLKVQQVPLAQLDLLDYQERLDLRDSPEQLVYLEVLETLAHKVCSP